MEDFHEDIICLAGRGRWWSMGWRESQLATINDHWSSSVQNSQAVESPWVDTANVQGVRSLQLNADYQMPFLMWMLKYSDGGMLLISRAISRFIPPFYSTSKNFYGIILDMLTFSSLFMAYRYSLDSQENTSSMYSMFYVHSILNIDISLTQVKFFQ